MQNTMKATVSGFDCEGKPFIVTCEFTMIPPANGNHYGTGYYMTVRMPSDTHLIDVRYEGTTDIEVLADRWILNNFGKNAREVIKKFPAMIAVKTEMHKMPANCQECKLGQWLECRRGCKAGKPEIKKSCLTKRAKDCPLVEVQTEGK